MIRLVRRMTEPPPDRARDDLFVCALAMAVLVVVFVLASTVPGMPR